MMHQNPSITFKTLGLAVRVDRCGGGRRALTAIWLLGRFLIFHYTAEQRGKSTALVRFLQSKHGDSHSKPWKLNIISVYSQGPSACKLEVRVPRGNPQETCRARTQNQENPNSWTCIQIDSTHTNKANSSSPWKYLPQNFLPSTCAKMTWGSTEVLLLLESQEKWQANEFLQSIIERLSQW